MTDAEALGIVHSCVILANSKCEWKETKARRIVAINRIVSIVTKAQMKKET